MLVTFCRGFLDEITAHAQPTDLIFFFEILFFYKLLMGTVYILCNDYITILRMSLHVHFRIRGPFE